MAIAAELNKLVRINRVDNTEMSIEDSIVSRIAEMVLSLNELKDGEYNGLSITDAQKPENLRQCLQPVLEATAIVQNVIAENGGYAPSLNLEFNGRSRTVDLKKITEDLKDGVSLWLRRVDKEHADIAADVGKPLAINDDARENGVISSLTAVLTNQPSGGWVPKGFA